jgi:signal transduction histidine kinase
MQQVSKPDIGGQNMNQQHKGLQLASTLPTTSADRRNEAETRLHGSRLVLARAAWIIVVVLSLAVSIAYIPLEFRQLHTVCVGSSCGQQLTAGIAQDLRQLNLSVDFFARYLLILQVGSLLVWAVVALLIFWRRSNDRVALLVALFLVLFPAAQGLGSPDTVGAAYPSLQLLTTFLDILGWLSLLLFFYLFPDGQFVPRWTCVVALGYAILTILGSLFPNLPLNDTISFLFGLPLLIAVVGIGLFSQIYRYRRVSGTVQRQQTRWVVYGVVAAVLLFICLISLGRIIPHKSGLVGVLLVNTAIYSCELLIPLSIGFSILRYRLYDIDIIINRTLVYSLLTASVIGIYALVVGTLGTVFQAQGGFLISLVGAGLVAVLFQPLRLRLQRGANRLMYGERDTPSKVISRLGQRLETTLAPDAVLPTIVETVAQALKLPYAAITLQQDGEFVPAASYGQVPKEDLVRLPLVYPNEQVGELRLAPRAPGETFSSADLALLNDLARQAGIAASAVRLTIDLQRLAGELQHSRTQLVTTREEERRRLRRDLHDGLGPALGSLTLQLDTARNLFKRDPPAADELLVDLKTQVQTAIADIRRLVYELRPPTLDELGLVSALREQVTRYRQPGLSITLNVPEHLPPLPAAVEVALYRIAQEALTNVVRHAHAQHCVLTLEVDNDACLEVRDDGQGLAADDRAGVGLTSMRERATELGGTCAFAAVEAGGTRVFVRLPLLKE